VTLAINPRIRALLIVGVLAIAAFGAGLMVLNRSQGSASASPPPAPAPAPTPAPAPAPKASAPKTSVAPRRPARAVPPTAPRLKAKRRPLRQPVTPSAAASPDALPPAIAQPLAANRVVVVALYDPAAKIDSTAVNEASAGAELAGTVFVAIDVTTTDVDALNAHYGVIHDPAVLVLRPPGDLVVRIDGFADRDTVAQAAANAIS